MVQPVQCTPMSKDKKKKKYDISVWTKAADQMSTTGPKYAVLYGADFFFFPLLHDDPCNRLSNPHNESLLISWSPVV